MSVHLGSGPGEITPDGCAVEFYSLAALVEGVCPAGEHLPNQAGVGHRVRRQESDPDGHVRLGRAGPRGLSI